MYAYLDTTKLISTISTVDGLLGGLGSSLLTSTFQCGTMTTDSSDTANYIINAIPNFQFSVSLEMFDDVELVHVPGMPDDLASTERMAFLSCFFSRQGRLPAFPPRSPADCLRALPIPLNLPDLTPGDPNSTMNPTVQYTLQQDAEGTAILGATFDPQFNLGLSDQTALGPHTQYGPLRILSPAFRVLESIPTTDPSGVATNLLRYFVLFSAATVPTATEVNGQIGPPLLTYTGPAGMQTYSGDSITPLLPMLQPLLANPSVANSTLSQALDLFWTKLRTLPVDGSTMQATLLSVLAEALQARSNPNLPPLWQPTVDALTAHKDEMNRTLQALWPNGGAFALDQAPGG